MKKFNNKEYEKLVTDLIGDIFYTETSYRGKIGHIRQYSEVVIRKILNIDRSEKVTLGSEKIRNKLIKLKSYDSFSNTIEEIREIGNKTIHTQHTEDVSEEDYNRTLDLLFDLIAFLFVNYFDKYTFGARPEIMSLFSLLPPIIRAKVLKYLYEENPEDINVIDKLSLVLLKAYGFECAIDWIESNRDKLIKQKTYTEEGLNQIIEKYGEGFASLYLSRNHENMYQLCKSKLNQLNNTIDKNGALYTDFESAKPFYLDKKRNSIYNTDEAKELIDIMDFIYMGRKENLDQMKKIQDYIIINPL